MNKSVMMPVNQARLKPQKEKQSCRIFIHYPDLRCVMDGEVAGASGGLFCFKQQYVGANGAA